MLPPQAYQIWAESFSPRLNFFLASLSCRQNWQERDRHWEPLAPWELGAGGFKIRACAEQKFGHF